MQVLRPIRVQPDLRGRLALAQPVLRVLDVPVLRDEEVLPALLGKKAVKVRRVIRALLVVKGRPEHKVSQVMWERKEMWGQRVLLVPQGERDPLVQPVQLETHLP